MAVMLIPPSMTFFDANDNPASGGLLYWYTIGTTTPKDTYTDDDLITPNANPVVLTARGRTTGSVWGSGLYKLVVKDASGNTIGTFDPANSDDTLNSAYYACFTFLGNNQTASERVGIHVFPRAVTFAANWATSYGDEELTAPAATFLTTGYKNGVEVGTVSISTGGAYTFATTGAATVSFVAGDSLTFDAPAVVDATIKNFAWTLVGALA